MGERVKKISMRGETSTDNACVLLGVRGGVRKEGALAILKEVF